MAQRTKARQQKLRTIELREDIVRSPATLKVDRDKGIIYHVKILGLESANGRRYSQQAITEAVTLYEGRAVNTDHPAKPSDQRSVYDRFGWFENVKAEPTGLYGDFHLVNPKTELAESLFNAAEKKPDLYGFSHNALGEGDTVDGVFVVGRITEVRSVDLVAEPATTHGLFESKGRTPMKKITILKLFESLLPSLGKGKRKPLIDLIEDDAMSPALAPEMDEPAPMDGAAEVDPNAALKDGFHAAIMPLLDAALDGDVDALKQLNDFVKTHAKIAAKPAEATEEEDDEEDEDEEEKPVGEGKGNGDDKEEDKDKMESLRRENEQLRREKRARELCEQHGVKDPSATLIEAVAALDSDEKRKKLIQEHKSAKDAQRDASRPRSIGTGRLLESGGNGSHENRLHAVKDGKSFAEALRRN